MKNTYLEELASDIRFQTTASDEGYRCWCLGIITDGRQRKFPKGEPVIILWRGTTAFGESIRVIALSEIRDGKNLGGAKYLREKHVKYGGFHGLFKAEQDEIESILINDGWLRDVKWENQPCLVYGKVVKETDKGMCLSLANEEDVWFAKSLMIPRGKLTDRDSHAFEMPLWTVREAIGKPKAVMFLDARPAIEKRLVT